MNSLEVIISQHQSFFMRTVYVLSLQTLISSNVSNINDNPCLAVIMQLHSYKRGLFSDLAPEATAAVVCAAVLLWSLAVAFYN